MEIKAGMIVENKLSNGQSVVCRVVGFIESVQMWRLTDALEVRDDAWLIEHNRTWAAPIENIVPHFSESCEICHKDGLISFNGGN